MNETSKSARGWVKGKATCRFKSKILIIMGINIVIVLVNDVDKHVIGIKNEILYMKSFLHRHL